MTARLRTACRGSSGAALTAVPAITIASTRSMRGALAWAGS